MKTKLLNLLGALAFSAGILTAAPLGTAFTYQGRLMAGANAATGIYDFRFTLYDAAGAVGGPGGIQVAGPITNAAIAISNGLFTTSLDFGAGGFAGESRWLELSVRTNGSGAFSALTPRQALTPAPFALFAPSAGVAATATSANGVASGAVGPLGLQNSAVDSLKIADGTISSLDLSTPLLHSTFWKLTGNGTTTPGANFLGTTDNQALELKVNNTRALRLEPNASGAPNLIGGAANNAVAAGKVGATISGGGGGSGVASNSILSDFATIGGGSGNSIQTKADFSAVGGGYWNRVLPGPSLFNPPFVMHSTIGGGISNTIWVGNSVIAGGIENTIGSSGSGSGGNLESGHSIGGGTRNTIGYEVYDSNISGGAHNFLDANYSTIAGGMGNMISWFGNTYGNAIGGGVGNYIVSNPGYSIISGGRSNRIDSGGLVVIAGGSYNFSGGTDNVIGGGLANTNQGPYTVIGGGWRNSVNAIAEAATISGGATNAIGQAKLATIGGGAQNRIGNDDSGSAVSGSVIGGGVKNFIDHQLFCIIGGGSSNSIAVGYMTASTIAGGTRNAMSETSFGVIAGGYANSLGNSSRSTIGGGEGNYMQDAGSCVIAGGEDNYLFTGDYLHSCSVIGGGMSNAVLANFGTIPGGFGNRIGGLGNYSLAAGRRAKVNQPGVFVWADSTDADFTSTGNNQFLIRASGGVGIGNAAPAAVLDVYGTRSISSTSDGIVNVGDSSSLHVTLDNNELHARSGSGPSTLYLNDFGGNVNAGRQLYAVYNSGVGIGTASLAGYKFYVSGTAYSTGGWSGSDARWKKNVQPVSHALKKVMELRGVTYDWRRAEFPDRNFDTSPQLGFLAQDVEQVVPEAVRTDAEGYKAIAYEKLTAVLTEGVKEQQQQIEELKTRNARLEQTVAELKALVEGLAGK